MDQQCLDEMLANQTFLVPTIAALRNILDNAERGIPSYVVDKARAVEQRHRESFQMYYRAGGRSEEHTSELQSLMRISYAVFCLKKKKKTHKHIDTIMTTKPNTQTSTEDYTNSDI